MSVAGSVTRLLPAAKAGDAQAARELWERFYPRLLAVARRRWRSHENRALDEDDLVTTAFQSFFVRVRDGQFTEITDRTALWSLLVRITERKVIDARRQARSLKRGGGRVLGESALASPQSAEGASGMAAAADQEPPPDYLAALKEDFLRLHDRLPQELRAIVLLKLDGHSHEEIAYLIERSVATIERRLRLVRERWAQELLQ